MNIIVVGLGTSGKHYINILKFKKNIKLYVIDINPVKKSKFFTITNFKEIKKKNLTFDYAIIATPSGFHYKHALFFLKRRTNVLIEKPFVLKLNHANKLIEISKKNKLKCWTSLQNRYNLATNKLKKELNLKKIGDVSLVDCTMFWHRNKEYYQNGWRGKYLTDGGVLTNQAIHLLDILIYNFGKIKYFNVIADFNKTKLEAEDLIIINFKHNNGILSSFKATTRANRNYKSAIDIIGSDGRIIINGVSLNTFNKFYKDKLVLDNLNSESFENLPGTLGGMGSGHKKILKEFLSAVKKSSKDIEISKNIYLLKVIHSIYNAIHKNKNLNAIKNINSLLG